MSPNDKSKDWSVNYFTNKFRSATSKLLFKLMNCLNPHPIKRVSISNAYDDGEFQSYIARKTKIFFESGLEEIVSLTESQKFAALSFVTRDQITDVVELGGGAGMDFFTALNLLHIKQKWTILETKAMCSAIRYSGIHHPLLTSISDLKDIIPKRKDSVTSLYMNASLQYFENPAEVFHTLLTNLKPEFVAAIRLPLCRGAKEISYVQKSKIEENGPQVEGIRTTNLEINCDVRIISEISFKSLLEKAGYEVILEEFRNSNFGDEAKFRTVQINEFLLLARKKAKS